MLESVGHFLDLFMDPDDIDKNNEERNDDF